MEQRLKQRLVGAAVIGALVVVFVPMLLERGSDPLPDIEDAPIPERPDVPFRSRIEPLAEAPPRPEPGPNAGPNAGASLGEPSAGQEPSPPPAAPPRQAGQPATGARGSGAAPAPGDDARIPGGWVVQLGSFKDPANAMALRDRLRQKGYTAFTTAVRVGDETTTRVLVGPELLHGNAEKVQARLRDELGTEGLLVRYFR